MVMMSFVAKLVDRVRRAQTELSINLLLTRALELSLSGLRFKSIDLVPTTNKSVQGFSSPTGLLSEFTYRISVRIRFSTGPARPESEALSILL